MIQVCTTFENNWHPSNQRIFKTRFKYDLRKFYFTNRVVDAWNSLPNWIVMANSTNTQVRYILARPKDYLRFSCIPEVVVTYLDMTKNDWLC